MRFSKTDKVHPLHLSHSMAFHGSLGCIPDTKEDVQYLQAFLLACHAFFKSEHTEPTELALVLDPQGVVGAYHL